VEVRALGYEALEPYLLLDAAVNAFEAGELNRAAQLAMAMRTAVAGAGLIPDPDDAAEEEVLETQLFWMGAS
jgi:hypothetical protein